MKAEILMTNFINLFIIAAVFQIAAMAIFSMKLLKDLSGNKPLETLKDITILAASIVVCFKVKDFTVFTGTGITVPRIFDIVISALIITRIAGFIQTFFERLKMG